ncbi:MAG TPA: hypothetical protein VNI02_25550 [Blastocatellia bacterium]|nr:hypothetical protein [Blastocatellia bacterium]
MNLKDFRRTVSGAALTLAMMLGITIASGASAQAQYRDYDRSGYGQQGSWSKERTRDYAYKLGYHNAYTEARRAYNSGVRPNYRDMAGYRNDTNGYLDYMRYRDDYRSSYRRGYEAGFNDSMNNRPRRYDRADVERVLGRDLERTYDDDNRYDDRDYRRGSDRGGYYGGRNDVYRIAQDNGYRDGLRQGQDDASRRRRYNYNDDNRYRDASSGYRSEYGNRDAYRQAYREGFQRGYDEGFRRNGNNRGGVRLPWPF